MPSPSATCSAASSVNPPAKTESRRNTSCSSGSSSWWLQSSVARIVCWRSGRGGPAMGEQVQLLPEAGGDLLRAERTQPCGRQLDGERQARELRAYPHHGCGIAVGEPEARPHVAATLNQEPDGVVLGQSLEG